MEYGKYPLEILLLYIENQLPAEEAKEISLYLINNSDLLNHLINLAKVKVRSEYTSSSLFFEMLNDKINYTCTGLINFVDSRKVAFRGHSKVNMYEFSFIDINLFFTIGIDNIWNLLIKKPSDPFECEILDENANFLLKKNIKEDTIVFLAPKMGYKLFYYHENKIDYFEFILPEIK